MKFLFILLTFFFMPQLSYARGLDDREIANVAQTIMKEKGFETKIIEAQVLKSMSPEKNKKYIAVYGSYLRKIRDRNPSYGWYLLFLSSQPAHKYYFENLVLHPGDYEIRPLFFDLNNDRILDLIINSGEETDYSARVLIASKDHGKLSFKEVFSNEYAYLYPFDLNSDGKLEIILPDPSWRDLYSHTSCDDLNMPLPKSTKKKILRDHQIISKGLKNNPWKRNARSINDSSAYYFSNFKIINFIGDQFNDVSSDFKSYYEKRIKMLEEIIRQVDLEYYCREELIKSKKALQKYNMR